MELSHEEKDLAAKLADAGPTEEEAEAWVSQVIEGSMKRRFRQVGWQINGGINDGTMFPLGRDSKLDDALKVDHGGFSPIYVEVGD